MYATGQVRDTLHCMHKTINFAWVDDKRLHGGQSTSCLQVDSAIAGEVSKGPATSDSTQTGSVNLGTNTILVCL